MTQYKIKYKKKTKVVVGSSRLYSTPSMLVGLGTLFNICGNYYDFNYSQTEIEADSKAIEKDWETVGKDLKTALESI